MILELEEFDDLARARPRADGSALPAHLIWTQRAAATLRAFVAGAGRTGDRIFIPRDLELHDLDDQLPKLDPSAKWEPAPPATETGEPVGLMTDRDRDEDPPRLQDSGFLHLKSFDLILARWWWYNPDSERGKTRSLYLCAAPNVNAVHRLRDTMAANRRGDSRSVWKIVSGYSYDDQPDVPRCIAQQDELILPPAIEERLSADVLRFFTPAVETLYRTLKVPYRRGVLLYGPPGNGKTSIIRWIGGTLSHVPALIVRPSGALDSDNFAEIIRRWKTAAPSILVIEDLNWMIEQVNISTFLNTLDGIDEETGGGLLLIATTNYPEKLDPAINNRPGRFDVAIEIASPDVAARREFFRRKLPGISASAIDAVSKSLDHCSFAHLHEVLRLSGLYAIHAGRAERIEQDLTRAARDVAAAQDSAADGFRPKLDVPFGLQHLQSLRQN